MTARAILVVDPDPTTARKVAEVLRGSAIELLHRPSVPADLDSLLAERELVALLAAPSLEGESGYELCRRVKERFPRSAIFLLSGGFTVVDPERAASSGVDATLRRPLSAHAVREHLERLLGPLPESEPAPPREEPSPAPPRGTEAPPPDDSAVRTLPPEAIAPEPRPLLAEERLATFIPQDYDELPPVQVDPELVSVALEQSILAALPEALEIVLSKSLRESPDFKRIVEEAVKRAVEEQLPTIARSLRNSGRLDG